MTLLSDDCSRRISGAFTAYPNWRRSESELRELRKQVTFALVAETDDLERVSMIVESLFSLLQRAQP